MQRIASVNQDPGISPARNKGAAVHLASMRKAFTAFGYQVIAMDEPDGGSLERELMRQRNAGGLALIYERFSLGTDRAAKFARRHGIPLVLEVNAPLADERSRYRQTSATPEERERERFVFANATLVIAVSSAVADYAVSRGADSENVLVCPNGVDQELFNASVRDRKAPLPGIPESSTVLGFHGRERPWHGFEFLVETVAKLLERGHDIHFLVVGEGAFEALRLLPEAAWTRLPWQLQERLPDLLAHFDILPLAHLPGAPYYFSPLKLTEAMACGVVPVVPDLGDLAKCVRHGETGFVYPPEQTELLVATISALCSAGDARKAVGERAAAWASRQTWTSIAHRILSHPLLALAHHSEERVLP